MADSPGLAFSEQDDSLVCTLVGHLDTQACAAIEAELLAKVREAQRPVVFDLAGVSYVASMFFRLCLQVAREVGTKRFRIVQAQPAVNKVFKVAGLAAMVRQA